MSWRPTGNAPRPASPPPRKRPPSSSGREGPALIDPPLQALIIAALVAGVVMLGLMIAFGGGGLGGAPTQTAAQPPASPAAPAATTAPVATVAAPAALAATAAAPAAGAATIPTAPLGPALASGSGEPIAISSDGDLLAFDQTQITVPNGLVTLTFTNNASAVQHNWVLVNGGDDVATAVDAAAGAQVRVTRNAAGAVPPADTPDLLVATQMLNAGEAVTVTFQTPGPGTYEFICTFPGHYSARMRGSLVVQ